METNYRVYYYVKGDLVRSHTLRNDHLTFILGKFGTSPRVVGNKFTLEGTNCDIFCTYIDWEFCDFFANRFDTSIDVVRFADLDNDFSELLPKSGKKQNSKA